MKSCLTEQKFSASIEIAKLSLLTTGRIDLIKIIALHKPKSLYILSRLANKNQANVLRDVRILESLGIVKLTKVAITKRISLRPTVVCDAIEIRLLPRK